MAVEEGISDNLREMLKKEGYEVVSPYRGQNVDAIIISGLDNNVMNMQDIADTAPVIDASGKTAGDIIRRLREIRL
ncbi:MAG: YkuS family protein [Bacillota bacterium]